MLHNLSVHFLSQVWYFDYRDIFVRYPIKYCIFCPGRHAFKSYRGRLDGVYLASLQWQWWQLQPCVSTASTTTCSLIRGLITCVGKHNAIPNPKITWSHDKCISNLQTTFNSFLLHCLFSFFILIQISWDFEHHLIRIQLDAKLHKYMHQPRVNEYLNP